MKWKPFDINELRHMLRGFDRGFLDGGLSLDQFLEKSTRAHGDIDIGVFSEDAVELLTNFLKSGLSVFDASGGMKPVVSPSHRELSYNYLISVGKHYKVQILVYTVQGDEVVFRRNPAIRWPKSSFILTRGELQIVNPLVLYAFKVTAKSVEQKDLADIISLTDCIGQ